MPILNRVNVDRKKLDSFYENHITVNIEVNNKVNKRKVKVEMKVELVTPSSPPTSCIRNDDVRQCPKRNDQDLK